MSEAWHFIGLLADLGTAIIAIAFMAKAFLGERAKRAERAAMAAMLFALLAN